MIYPMNMLAAVLVNPDVEFYRMMLADYMRDHNYDDVADTLMTSKWIPVDDIVIEVCKVLTGIYHNRNSWTGTFVEDVCGPIASNNDQFSILKMDSITPKQMYNVFLIYETTRPQRGSKKLRKYVKELFDNMNIIRKERRKNDNNTKREEESSLL